MRRPPVCALLVALGLFSSEGATAEERIHDFHAELVVGDDSRVTVTETIAVSAEGEQIRRGIYRDLPTDYRDRLGNRIRIVPELLEVRRNGAPEGYHTERRSNGLRIYAGSRDRLIAHGVHEYELTYRADRVLGYFEDYDELYWNVTGNGWAFPITQASAMVRLPASVSSDAVRWLAYTGPEGATGGAYRAEIRPDGAVYFATTRALAPGEGLTIVVAWPKGHVEEPGFVENARFLLSQNLGLLIALGGGLAALFYLVVAWRRTGVDPPAGVVFPHYEPPSGYSPASLRYVVEMGYDKRTFTAAVLNLAVKGFLTIREEDDEYTLALTGKEEDTTLRPGERTLLGRLFADGPELVLENENHAIVGDAMKAHERALKRDYYQRYFVTNRLLLVPAVVLLTGMLIAILLLDRVSIATGIVLGACAGAVLVFAWLLKAPTPHGRRLLDRIEGFRLYLEVAEKEDLDLGNPPEETPELFERYLPYALALEVEQRWAERFARVLASLRDGRGERYHPRWYSGRWDTSNPAGMARAVGGSLTSAIASAATPPGSSSGGGGGGFSGGGGGGGGGGGW